MIKNKAPRFGKLLPKYTFILNRYVEYRFTRCPSCDRKMKQRKLPLWIHVDPINPVALNYTCRYCPDCDLLIAHQDEIETLLAQLFAQVDPSVVGNDYLIIGTIERPAWREGLGQPRSIPDMLEYLHDFQEVQTVRVQPGGWYPKDMDPSQLPVQEPAPLDTPWQKKAQSTDDRPDKPKKSAGSPGTRKRQGRRRKR